MKPHQITLIVSVVGIYHGCADVARDDEPAIFEPTTEIRIVSNDQIEFHGVPYSTEEIDQLVEAFDRRNLAEKSSPGFRATFSVAADVPTGLVEQMADALGEHGYERVSLGLIDDSDAQDHAVEPWLEPLMRLKVEIGPEVESEYTIIVRLSADDDAALEQVYFGANRLGADVPQCIDRLNNQVAALVGAGGDMMDEVVVELDAAESLQFRYAFAALIACAGRQDADGRWIDYIRNLRFDSPSENDVIFNNVDDEALTDP